MTTNKSCLFKAVFNKRFFKCFLLVVIFIAIDLGVVIAAHCFNRLPKDSRQAANESPPRISGTGPQIPEDYHQAANESNNQQRSESMDQLNTSPASAGSVKVIYNIPVKQPVVFITIDDGWYPDVEVLKLMKKYHLPITTFLISRAARKYPAFWHEFANDGGHIEDHTVSHPFLTHLSLKDAIGEISRPINYLSQFGPPPDELRPPYGDFDSEVGKAAGDAGIKYIVMWNAEMRDSNLYTIKSRGLKPGDIILLHWVKGLDQEMLKLLSILRKQHLGVADLTQALNEGSVKNWTDLPPLMPKPLLFLNHTEGGSNTVNRATYQ